MASPRLSSLLCLFVWPLLIVSLSGPSTLASPLPPAVAGKGLPHRRWEPIFLSNRHLYRGGARKQLNLTERGGFNPIPKLSVSIIQTSAQRPKIKVKVTNGNAAPITLAPYATPLDDQAEELGIFLTTPKNATCEYVLGPFWMSRLMPRRLMPRLGPMELECTNITPRRLDESYDTPPNPERLIGLGPGQSRENEIEMKTDGIGNGTIVTMKAWWVGVWAKEKGQVAEELKAGKAWKGEEWIGPFKSNPVVLLLNSTSNS